MYIYILSLSNPLDWFCLALSLSLLHCIWLYNFLFFSCFFSSLFGRLISFRDCQTQTFLYQNTHHTNDGGTRRTTATPSGSSTADIDSRLRCRAFTNHPTRTTKVVIQATQTRAIGKRIYILHLKQTFHTIATNINAIFWFNLKTKFLFRGYHSSLDFFRTCPTVFFLELKFFFLIDMICLSNWARHLDEFWIAPSFIYYTFWL